MVDARREPLDFKVLDPAHVEACARLGRCGVCGKKIRRGPIAFIGPDDGRTCFADPWMHEPCAALAMRRCPFLGGRRDWSEAEARNEPLLATYSTGMAVTLARSWRAHRDAAGAWHFEALGPVALVAQTALAVIAGDDRSLEDA
jgi:hypothetical protein